LIGVKPNIIEFRNPRSLVRNLYISFNYLLIITLAACSVPQYRDHVKLTLEQFDDLIISNSRAMVGDVRIEKEKAITKFGDEFIIYNSSAKKIYNLDIGGAVFEINSETIPSKCKTAKGTEEKSLTINPRQKVLISCEWNVNPNEKNQVKRKENVGYLKISYAPNKYIQTGYKLRLEDFENE
jgi:hypothetical protein